METIVDIESKCPSLYLHNLIFKDYLKKWKVYLSIAKYVACTTKLIKADRPTGIEWNLLSHLK